MVGKKGREWFLLAGTALLLLPVGVLALNDGAARTPPMGFSTWNFFGCNNINEANVLNVAKSMVLKHAPNWEGKQISLNDVGYVFINLDDCWESSARNSNGSPTWNTTEFPHGFPWLTDSIHKMGLQMGIYSDCGTATCAGHYAEIDPSATPTKFYDSIDAVTWINWGFTYLKLDWCNISGPASSYNNAAGCASLYSRMGHTLWATADSLYAHDTTTNKVYHRITFSLCQWGDFNVWTWGDTCGHLWRTTGDITATWSGIYNNFNSSIAHYANAGPGGWNDPDMLEIGNGSLTAAQNQAHMDLWCISAAPLLIGNNTPAMTEATFTILSNREVIAVDQDSLGSQGVRVRTTGNIQVMVKKLRVHVADTVNNKKFAVVILNNQSSAAAGSIKWSDLGITDTSKQFRVRNLWLHRWLNSRNIMDTAIAADSTIATEPKVSESLYVASIPADGTVHVLMEMGNPDSVNKVLTLPQDKAAISAQLGSRMSVRGSEIFVPVARSTLQVFDMTGRQIASISASQPGWYSVAGCGVVHGGTYLVRLSTLAGSVSRVMAFTK